MIVYEPKHRILKQKVENKYCLLITVDFNKYFELLIKFSFQI